MKRFRQSDPVASDLQAQQDVIGNQSLSHWSIEFFEESFPSDYVLGNGISNTINDLVMGDQFSEWAFTLGDHCRPASDRAWAGMKIIGMGGLMAGGGIIARGLICCAGGLIKLLRSSPAKPAVEKLALGLGDRLDDFAASHGAGTWKGFPDPANWKPTMVEKLADPKLKVLFNLDGVEVMPGVQRAAAGRGGATDWELLQIKQNPAWWDSIEWYLNGKPVGNPFQ